MKTIKLDFVDFWKGFNKENNYFINVLKKIYNIELSSEPDYIIYAYPGYAALKYDCVRIFFTAENIRPDFNLCDYAIGFDWMSFEDRYYRLPLYRIYEEDFKKALIKHKISDSCLDNKSKFCNFIYSNGDANIIRENFFYLLNRYRKVDSGGKYLNNIGYYVNDKFEFQQQYKFSIAFENSSTIGYTTEKLIQAAAAGTIPIYWGNPEVHREFNTKSFINCHEYNNFDDVVSKVIEIDQNPELYYEMMKEPLFYDDVVPKNLTEEALLDFFTHIFDQPIERALRREKYCHTKWYEERVRQQIKINEFIPLQVFIKWRKKLRNII